MEPAEFAAYTNAPESARGWYALSPQWSLDIGSSMIYAGQGNEARASEHQDYVLSSPEYWFTAGLGILGGAVARTPVAVIDVERAISYERMMLNTGLRNQTEINRWFLGGNADFYVTSSGTAIPATGYRAVGGPAVDEAMTGIVSPRNPATYFTFDDISNALSSDTQSFLQLPHTPSHWLRFDTLQIIDDIRTPTGRWNTTSVPEPITNTFPELGNGGATQAVTNSPIRINELGNFPSGGSR